MVIATDGVRRPSEAHAPCPLAAPSHSDTMDLADALARNARARAFFEKLDSANRYAILYRVQSAKKPETRAERIQRFVGMCAQHETIHPQRPAKARPRAGTKRRSFAD